MTEFSQNSNIEKPVGIFRVNVPRRRSMTSVNSLVVSTLILKTA